MPELNSEPLQVGAVTAGDPRHPDHERWLLELGRATYAASRVAGICFDVLRVLGGTPGAHMYNDPVGTLQSRLQKLGKQQPDLPGLSSFLEILNDARVARNDLIHALPVRDGLHRRRSNDPHYVRNFFAVADLEELTRQLTSVAGAGNTLLYHDGGAAIRAWYADTRH